MCVEIFREKLEMLEVSDKVPEGTPFSARLRELAWAKRAFLKDASASLDFEEVISAVEAQEALAAEQVNAGALGYDTEMEQEQEQEEEAQQEVQQEEQVHVDYASSPPIATHWPVAGIGTPDALLGGGVFHALNAFVLHKGVTPLPVSDQILLSENYATAMHRSDLPRRLKNVSVVLEWSLPGGHSVSGGFVDKVYVALSLAEAETIRRVIELTNGGDVLGAGIRLVLVGSPCVELGALQSYRPLGEGDDGALRGIGEEALDYVPQMTGLDVGGARSKFNVYRTVVAALLKSAGVKDEGRVARESRALARLQLFAGAAEYQPWVDDMDAAVQVLRFFDCQLWFSDEELIKLARGVGGDGDGRQAFFSAVIGSRRRDRVDWSDTRLASLFAPSEKSVKELLNIRLTTLKVAAKLAGMYDTPLAAFRGLDQDGDSWISLDEFVQACAGFQGIQGGEVLESVFEVADRDSDGFLNYREFASHFVVADAEVVVDGEVEVEGGGGGKGGLVGGLALMGGGGGVEGGVGDGGVGDGGVEGKEVVGGGGDDDVGTSVKGMSYAQLAAIGTMGPVSGGQVMVHDTSLVHVGEMEFVTLVPQGVVLGPGQWQFEVVLEGGDPSLMAQVVVGVGSRDLVASSVHRIGLGSDATTSAGFEGIYGVDWLAGDTLGVVVSVSPTHSGEREVELTLYVNGSATGDVVGPEKIVFGGRGVVPGVTLEWPVVSRVNFGAHGFMYPVAGADPVSSFVKERASRIHALNSGSRFGKLLATTGNAQMTISEDLEVSVEHGFPSAVLQGCLLTSGKWYYEATIVRRGVAQIGFADLEFVGSSRDGVGVGDDKQSVGVDFERNVVWYDGRQPYGGGLRWTAGTVVGVAADLDARTISFSFDGSWTRPCGVALVNFEFVAGLAPGVTLNPSAVRLNWGHTGLAHRPPPGYLPVSVWLDTHNPLVGPDPGAAAVLAAARAEAKDMSGKDGFMLRKLCGHAPLVLSMDDGVVECVGEGYPTVVDVRVVTSGRFTWEFSILDWEPESFLGFGLANLGWIPDHTSPDGWYGGIGQGEDGTSIGVDANGVHAKRGVGTGAMDFALLFGSRLASGDVLSVCVDMEEGRVWFGRNGGWVEGNGWARGRGVRFGVSVGKGVVMQLNCGVRPLTFPFVE